MSKTIYIGGRLESKEKGNVVTGANAILDDTKGKKQNVINKETDDELARLEQSKQDNLNFDSTPTEDSTNPVTSGGVYTAEKALSDAIEAILLLIPSAATALNKLVDTNTMNSSISMATATFRGTYNAVSDLGLTYQATHAQIEAALDALGLTADNNDFAFVQIPVSDQSQDIAKTERFKFNGTNWLYEYDLNTSGFTAAQWAAINSGITVALVTKLTDLPTAAALQLALNAKQDTLTFDNEPTALSQNPVTSGGIYTAIQAVATALSDYSTTTDGRLNVLEGLVPTEASSSNKLTDKVYVDGLIQAITELIPAEATTTNQLADKAYVLAQILAATPAFKGQFVTLAELQAVASPKAGDLGIVRTKDSDGMDVFTVYQYLNNAWNVFYSLSYHPQTKPATTGTTGDYPYNGMGRVELAKNMVNTGTDLEPVMVNQLTQDMFYKGAVGSRVPNTNTIFVIRYDYVLAENITIPDNCVLEFEGGSISGAYTITGANTGIKAGLVKIFDTTTTLAGTWDINIAHLSWYLNTSDYNASINKAMSLGHRLDFDDMEVYITAPIIQSVPLQNGTIRIADSVVTPLEKVIDISAYGSKISNLSIYGGSKAEIGIYGNQHQQMGLISDVYINNCTYYGLKLENCYIGSYNRIIVNNCGIGIYVHQAHNARITRCEFTGCNKGVVIDSGADVLIDGLDTSASQVCDIEMTYPMSSFSICNWYTENFAGDYILHIGNIGTINFQNCFVNCNGHKFIKLLKNYNNTELASLIFDSIRVTYCAAAIERESGAVISSLVFNGFIEKADQSAVLIPYADFIRTTTYNGIRYSRDKMIYEDIFVDSNWFGDSEYIATQDIKAENHKYMRGFNVFPTYKRGDQITIVDRVSNVGFITKAKVFIGDAEYILVANDNTLVYSNIPQDYVVSNSSGQSFVMLNQTQDYTGVLCIVETLSVRKPS